MDSLHYATLILIAKKFVAEDPAHLVHFMSTSVNNRAIEKEGEVLRIIPTDRNYFSYYYPSTDPRDFFFHKLVSHGHGGYSVMKAAKMLDEQGSEADVPFMKSILKNASSFDHKGTTFFIMFLKALGEDEVEVQETLSEFRPFLDHKLLMDTRQDILSLGFPHRFGSRWRKRSLPRGLSKKTFCPSTETCKHDGRKPGIFWPGPSSDDEYNTHNMCFLCSFDVEVHWFRHDFGFEEGFFF